MSRLPIANLGRRPSAGRVVVVLRARPEVVDAVLPAAAGLVGGHALLIAAFTRPGGMGGFLRRDRFAWLSAGAALSDAEEGAHRFAHTADRFSVALSVMRGEELELQIAAEACAHPDGSLFASARDAAAYLDAFAATRAEERRAWEPLAPTALAWRVPGLDDDAQRALAFDSAFRQVPVRLLHTPRARVEGVLRSAGAPPLPARP
jgi:hypothetical protein